MNKIKVKLQYCKKKLKGGRESGRVEDGKINLASHEYFRFDPHQHWYKRGCLLGFHSHCNRVKMSRVSLLVVFFLAAAA